jgi:hypothetical protein
MTVTLREGVATAEVENGLVLLNERTGHYWRLNATGALVLTRLLNGDTAADAAQRLHQKWNIPSADAQRDVHNLLDALRQNGIVP